MGVESKVFVVLNDNDLLTIGNAVVKAINEWLRYKLDIEVDKSGANNRFNFLNQKEEFNSERWSNGCHIDAYNFNSFSIIFGCGDGQGGEATRRRLFMCAVESDYSDIVEGRKLIFSLNYWGSSEEIIDIIADTLVSYGDTYKVYNDCEDDWLKVN